MGFISSQDIADKLQHEYNDSQKFLNTPIRCKKLTPEQQHSLCGVRICRHVKKAEGPEHGDTLQVVPLRPLDALELVGPLVGLQVSSEGGHILGGTVHLVSDPPSNQTSIIASICNNYQLAK